MTTTVLFIDTDILIHYRRLSEIDWLSLTESSGTRILIAPVVFRELNKHKERGNTAKLRKRAQAVLSDFAGIFRSETQATIRAGVELEYLAVEPLLDFAKARLSAEISDDHLLASIIQYCGDNPNTRCRLVTADLGLRLKAKSRGIAIVDVPDELRIPDEPDANEKTIRTLEAELSSLKNRIPSLTLSFEDRMNLVRFALGCSLQDATLFVAKEMEILRAAYAPLPLNRTSPGSTDNSERQPLTLRGLFGGLGQVTDEDIIAYNETLKTFHSAYDSYLVEYHAYKDIIRRSIRLHFCVHNDGNCPAEGVDVKMHFPDGFSMLTEHDFPNEPSRPEPPEKPLTRAEQMQRVIADLGSISEPQFERYMPNIAPAMLRNVSHPSIVKSNSYDVGIRVEKVKHGFSEGLDDIYVVFDTMSPPSSFHIDYRIHADNLPSPVSGQLHVVIDAKQ